MFDAYGFDYVITFSVCSMDGSLLNMVAEIVVCDLPQKNDF